MAPVAATVASIAAAIMFALVLAIGDLSSPDMPESGVFAQVRRRRRSLAHARQREPPVSGVSASQTRRVARTPSGFEFDVTDGGLVIRHHGRKAATLRGAAAEQFLADVERGDSQELIARVTGNYKRGNEPVAKNHPRNQSF